MSRRQAGISPLFTWRSAARCDESGLSPVARHVQLEISLWMSELGDSAFPSVQTLAACSGRSESTVRKAIRELEDTGWLVVRMNRGRGHTNVYIASTPHENHREPSVSRADDAPSGGGLEGVQGASAGRPADGSPTPSPEPENHRLPEVSGDGKTAGSRVENHRETHGKPPAPGPYHVRTTSGPRQQQQDAPPTDAAAAASVSERLAELRVSASTRMAAVADPERAAAWLELADREARENVAGFFVAGFQSGEWPSRRGPASTVSRGERRVQVVEQLVRDLREDGVDEARHRIDVEWCDLTSSERAELHERVDELASDLLPDPAATPAGQTAAAAAAREVA